MDADDFDGSPPDPPGELCLVAAAEPPASGGRPDLDMALDIFRCKRDSTPPPSSRGKTAIIDSYTRNLNDFMKKKKITFAVRSEKNRRNKKQIISDEKKKRQKKSFL
jgi:hypothetical protein